VIRGGFDETGEFVKLNGIRADRADRVYCTSSRRTGS
jgi:hypothetical protein